MGNLLQGLAMALGGGLRGYTDWKMYDNDAKRQDAEQKRRDAYEQALLADRAEARRQAEDKLRADNAEYGVYKGKRPTGKVDIGGGFGDAMSGHFIPKITLDNDKQYRDIGDGWFQDATMSRPGQKIQERQAAGKVAADARFEAAKVRNEERLNRGPVRGTPAYLKMLEDEERIKAKFDRPTQAETDRPGKERQGWIDDIVAAHNGDWAAINQAIARDPNLQRKASEVGYSSTELKAAINRWKATKGAGIGRETRAASKPPPLDINALIQSIDTLPDPEE